MPSTAPTAPAVRAERSTSLAAVSPTVLAKRLLESPAANPVTIAMRMINAINATTSSVLFLPPSAASAARATTGNPYLTGWLQKFVNATASPTGRPSRPQLLSIPNSVAIPTAVPPGAT